MVLREAFGLEALGGLKSLNSYDDINFFFYADPKAVNNKHLTLVNPHGYVLKITNSKDSQYPDNFDAQAAMMKQLVKGGLQASTPIPSKNEGDCKIMRKLKESGKKHMVRVLEYIPGSPFSHVTPWTTNHFYQCGQLVAKLTLAMEGFDHPSFHARESIWFLTNTSQTKEFTFAIEDQAKVKLALEIIEAFQAEVKVKESSMKKGIIHGDFNEQNILVRPNDKDFEIFSIIDFGDSHYGCVIYDLAIAIMYMMTFCTGIDPLLVGGHVLAGYQSLIKITETEMDVIKTCVCARFAQSLVLGAYSYFQDPTNDYVMTTNRHDNWEKLRALWDYPKDSLYLQWQQIVKQYKK